MLKREIEIERYREGERERTVIFETGMSSGCENKRGILGSRMVKSYGWSQISSGNFPNRPKPCERRGSEGIGMEWDGMMVVMVVVTWW